MAHRRPVMLHDGSLRRQRYFPREAARRLQQTRRSDVRLALGFDGCSGRLACRLNRIVSFYEARATRKGFSATICSAMDIRKSRRRRLQRRRFGHHWCTTSRLARGLAITKLNGTSSRALRSPALWPAPTKADDSPFALVQPPSRTISSTGAW